MPEELTDDLRRDSRREHERCGRVPRVVQADTGQPGCRHQTLKAAGDGVLVVWQANLVFEDVTAVFVRFSRLELLSPLASLMGRQQSDKRDIKWKGSLARIRFWR